MKPSKKNITTWLGIKGQGLAIPSAHGPLPLLSEPTNLLSSLASEGLGWQAPWGLAAAPCMVLC